MDVVGDRSVAEGGHLEVVQVDTRVGRAGQRLRTRPRPVRGLVRSRHALGQRMVGGERIAAGLEPGCADRRGMVAEPGLVLARGQDRRAHPRLGLLGAPRRGMPHPDPEGRGRGHARRPIA